MDLIKDAATPEEKLGKIFDALLALEKDKEDLKLEQESILQFAKQLGFEPKAIIDLLRLLKKDKEKEIEKKRILREYATGLKLENIKEII